MKNLLCFIGLHKWQEGECRCVRQHCRARNPRANGHEWIWDCEKCSYCDKVRTNVHRWNGCKCSTCGKTRDLEHKWQGDRCSVCGATRGEDRNGAKDGQKSFSRHSCMTPNPPKTEAVASLPESSWRLGGCKGNPSRAESNTGT